MLRRLASIPITVLLALLVAIVAVPAAAIIGLSGVRLRHESVAGARTAVQRFVDGLAAEQANLFAAGQQLLVALASQSQVREHDRRAAAMLAEILQLNQQYTNIFAIDLKGDVWASGFPAAPFNVGDRRYFVGALSSGQLASGEFVRSRANRKSSFNLAAPYRDPHGQVAGVIAVGFDLTYTRRLFGPTPAGQGGNYHLLDHRGVILVRGVDHDEFFGRPIDPDAFARLRDGPESDVFEVETGAGGREIVAYRKLRIPGEAQPAMYVQASVPLASVLRGAERALRFDLAALAALLLLAVALAAFAGKWLIVDRIRLLEQASRRLAAGDREVRVSDLVSGAELGRLGLTFDAMAGTIAAREHAAERSERNYREIFDATSDAVLVHDARTGEILEVNRAAQRMYGTSREELLHSEVGQLSVSEEGYSAAEAARRMSLAVERGPQSFTWRACTKGGVRFWAEVVLSATTIGGENRVLAVVRDISERRRAEEQLQKLASVVEASSDFIGLASAGGEVQFVNRAGLHLVGLASPEALAGRRIEEFVDPPELDRFGAAIKRVFRGEAWFGELRLRRFDTGAPVPAEMNVFAIADPASGRPLALATVTRDISDRKRAEEEREKLQAQLLQSQKMEAVGRLAGGVAHDFNNLLTVIVNGCTLVLEEPGLSPEVRGPVEEVRQAGESAASLTRQLLAFSRKQVLQPTSVDLNALVSRMDRMLRRVIGEDVALASHLGSELWPVRADASQLEQVIMNLAVNARDAMPGGGQLTIETGNVLLDEAFARQHADTRPGEYVMLAVSDSGRGMEAATLARVFEPFFSTKGQLGTGLGLSTVHGIVRQSGGSIWPCSEPGRGTTFRIYLPRDPGEATTAAPPGTCEPAPVRGETVLVVEDAEGVRNLVVRVLLRRGYRVLQASNADEALAVAGQEAGPIHLLVTDVVMPGGGGRQLADWLGAGRPGLAVLYMSGYTEDAIVHQGVLDPGIEFLAKPFTMDTLVTKVGEMLQRRRP